MGWGGGGGGSKSYENWQKHHYYALLSILKDNQPIILPIIVSQLYFSCFQFDKWLDLSVLFRAILVNYFV